MLDNAVHSTVRASTALLLLVFLGMACTQGPPPATDAGGTSLSTAPAVGALGWRDERLGGVGPGSAEADITNLLGKPTTASPVVEEGATGDFTTVWEYPAAGVSLVLRATKKEGPFSVKNLSIAAPSKLKTSTGIGVGSLRAAVEAAYAADLNKELSNESLVVVGTDMYEGIKIRLDNGVVSSIALGGDGE